MKFIDITQSTTVGNFNDTIKALEEAKKKDIGTAEKNKIQQFINKYTQSRDKLIGVCKNDIIKGNMKTDYNSKKEIGNLIRDNFKKLSLAEWNKYIETTKDGVSQHKEKELNVNDGQGTIDFLEGKSGINLMTGVKGALSLGVVSSLFWFKSPAVVGFFESVGFLKPLVATVGKDSAISIASIIPKIVTGLWAVNPVLAVAGVALMGVGLAMLVKKVFGPEIKKMWTNHKVKHAVRNVSNASKDELLAKADISEYLDDLNPDAYADKTKEEASKNIQINDGSTARNFLKESLSLSSVPPEKRGAEIKNLMTKYAASGLSDEKMVEILQNAGLYVEDPEINHLITDIGSIKAGTTASKGFEKFRDAYSAVIKTLGDNKKTPQERLRAVEELKELATKREKFLDKSEKSSKKKKGKFTYTSNREDNERADKIVRLCSAMAQLTEEMLQEIILNKDNISKINELKTTIEKNHGLLPDQIEKL